MNLAEGETSRYHLCLPVPHGGGPSRVRQTKGCVHPKRCNVRTRHSLLAFAFSLLLRAVFRRLHCRPLAPTGASLKHNRRVLAPITAFNKRYCIISNTGCQGVVHIECARSRREGYLDLSINSRALARLNSLTLSPEIIRASTSTRPSMSSVWISVNVRSLRTFFWISSWLSANAATCGV